MRDATAYLKTQTITLSREHAFAELYLRLAHWTRDIISQETPPPWSDVNARLDRCIALVGYMSAVIDVKHNYEIAAAILTLHRFSISTLVRAKSERHSAHLDGLPQVFVSLSEILLTIAKQRDQAPTAPPPN